MNNIRGRYSKASLKEQLLITDQPSTSVQDIVGKRINDTSSDQQYPNKRYTSIKNLGDGSASLIFEGYDNVENKKVLIKKIPKNEYWKKELSVLKVMSDIKSKRILKYLDYYESRMCSYIITEFYDGIDLFEHIELNIPYSLIKGLQISLEMAKCIYECHLNNVIHLDIKCENYMVPNEKVFVNGKPNIILIDFGHSEIIPKEESINKLRKGYSYGTSYYTCPEGHYRDVHSAKSDVWSLGICIYLLLTGDYPFSGRKKEYYKNATQNNVTVEIEDQLVKSFVCKMIDADPFKRPDMKDVVYFLQKVINEYKR